MQVRITDTLLVGMENCTATLEVCHKTKHTVTIQPSKSTLGICPRETKTYVHTTTLTSIFIANLCVVAEI